MEEKKIEVFGQQIYYIENKVKSDVTLLFLHGWGTDRSSFLPIINNLKENVRIVSIDFPGFGQSEEPKKIYGVKDYAELVDEFINKLELKNILIVAHSFGGRVSFYLSQMNQEVNKMLLTGAAGIKPKREWKYQLGVLNYKFQKLLIRTPFYFQYKEDLFANSGSEDYKKASPVMKQVLIKVVNEDLSFLFSQITQKTILFWGEDDLAVPLSDAKKMQEEILNSELIVVEGSHYAFLENVEKFTQKVKELIEK